MTLSSAVCLLAIPSLLATFVIGTPGTGTQHVLHSGPANSPEQHPTSLRKLHGRFLHITDLHPDEHYQVHTSTEEGIACHRGDGPAGTYGAETSDCDSPLALVNATLDWITANLKDSIDFVVYTGDSARHDSDEALPRHKKDILAMNRRIADDFVTTFSDDQGLVVPVVPTFGNNDIYPHNTLMPGPNDVLSTYADIWKSFIPEHQRHSFEFGGWFYVEVIPDKLAVFSLNTLYFFDRNAGIDDCVEASEPGSKHFDWLRVQLGFMRERGMKAILMGHVPPARTSGKQLWEETCWQKYTLWLQQYRDVVVGSLYGHMNIDHFLFQDTKDIDISFVTGEETAKAVQTRESMEDRFSIESSKDYLMELREDWANLPDDIEESVEKKHKKKGKGKLGGPWAERYQLTLIGPSVVPNYLPTLRVIDYNITGLEDTKTWVDAARLSGSGGLSHSQEFRTLELRDNPELHIEKKKKKKGKKGKKPKNPNLIIPDPPAKKELPGPAYLPQPLTFTGFTQYYANLTYLNNDIAPQSIDDEVSPMGWDAGKHKDKKPKHDKPRPREFSFEVEYTTFDDKIYRLKDLTVRSLLDLAHRIGQASSTKAVDGYECEDGNDNETEDDVEPGDDELDDTLEIDKKKKKKKKGKKHKGGKKKKKDNKVWLHFLRHAFVSTRSKDELKDMT
ncbi:Endopolyphosphatase [Xylariaceae sp. FL0662B]|nr:Endopolyphosphatase [Xylariaceae sp. FL0662B]